jgi:hypothetical protein
MVRPNFRSLMVRPNHTIDFPDKFQGDLLETTALFATFNGTKVEADMN